MGEIMRGTAQISARFLFPNLVETFPGEQGTAQPMAPCPCLSRSCSSGPQGCCRGSRLEEGRGLQVAMGTRASGLFLHTWLACFTSREPVGWGQDATSSAPTCREVTSGLALGHPPLGSRALASPKHVGSWLQGGSFVTTWVSNHIKGCGERLAAFGHGQTWDRGCGCPQPHPSLSSGTFPTSPSAQLGRDLSQ